MTTIQQYESCGKANWVDDPLNIYYVLDLETIKYHGNIEKIKQIDVNGILR